MSVVAFSSPAKQINGPQGSELAVAGALIKEPELIGTLATRLRPEDFSHPLCRTVFEVALECRESGLAHDAGLFAEKIRERTKSLDSAFFRNAQALSVAACMEQAKRVKILSLLRSFRAEATELLKNPTAENILKVSNILAELSGVRNNGPAKVSSVAEQVVESLKNPLEGISYGFADLDSWTGGMKPGEFIVLAGRPGMGKSSLAVQLALRAARRGKKVAFFSLEVSAQQVVQKALSMLSGIPAQDIRLRRVNPDEVREYAEMLSETPLWIYDDGRQSPETVRSALLSLKNSEGLDLAVIDYLQLLTSGDKHAKGYDEITELSRRIKQLSRELALPILTLSQLSREVENRTNKRPTLSDLRGSGAIEQDADTVLFLYREKYYRPSADNTAEIILAKQREGPVGTAKAIFDPETTAFLEDFREENNGEDDFPFEVPTGEN